jgi:hypothetical protein
MPKLGAEKLWGLLAAAATSTCEIFGLAEHAIDLALVRLPFAHQRCRLFGE